MKTSKHDRQAIIKAEAEVCSSILNILKTPYIMTMNKSKISIVYNMMKRQLDARYQKILQKLLNWSRGIQEREKYIEYSYKNAIQTPKLMRLML